MPAPQPIGDVQCQRNRVTRDDWESYSTHRQRVTELLVANSASSDSPSSCVSPSLCVLGAGNANDLDLQTLADHFQKITLVDLDGEALDFGASRLPQPVARRVEVISGVDVSGIFTDLDRLSRIRNERQSESPPLAATQADREQIEPLIRAAREVSLAKAIRSRYSVVASTCLFSQLVDAVDRQIGSQHPQFLDLVLAVREGHLNAIRQLTAPGGTGVVITDFVSSDTLPQLGDVPDSQLDGLLAQAIQQGNFFRGVHPGALLRDVQSRLGPGSTARAHSAWRWQMGNRVFAVCAVSFPGLHQV